MTTPYEIKRNLDRYVIGQEEAKKALSVAAYGILSRRTGKYIPKENILLVGPTGTGKTYLIETLCHLYDIPFAICDASRLTGNGYRGEDVDQVLERLCQCDTQEKIDPVHLKAAENGLIFIDEFDKVAGGRHEDRSDEMVQSEFLKMAEGTAIDLNDHGKPVRRNKPIINTKNITFVFAGAFLDMKSPVSTIGFEKELCGKEEIISNKRNLRQRLIEYGISRELLGRIAEIITLSPLTKEDLYKVLTESNGSVLLSYQKLFEEEGCTLDFKDYAIEELCDMALSSDIGARGLNEAIAEALKEARFIVPSEPGIKRVVVDSLDNVEYER